MTAPDKTVAFTGHRPDKIEGGFDETSSAVIAIKQQLRAAILKKIETGCTCFLSGMAMGADLWAAEIVLELKKSIPSVTLVAAVPFSGQAAKFPPDWKKRYNNVLNSADEVHVLSQDYYRSCYYVRNRWLLSHASHLIAVYNGSRGGTMQTVGEALTAGHQIEIIPC